MIKKKMKLFAVWMVCALAFQWMGANGLAGLAVQTVFAEKAGSVKWMSELPDYKRLSELSIPGTHDSGARYGGFAAICQDATIDEQLAMGVRFLDIRCRYYDDGFAIHHGVVYQHLNFQDVLNACKAFLYHNPGEVIVMSIKEEHSDDSVGFENRFDRYVAENPGIFYQPGGRWSSDIPTVGQTRGKIVLLRRFRGTQSHSNAKGIGAGPESWAVNSTFTIDNGNTKLKIQDVYQTKEKWPHFQPVLEDAKNGDLNTLYVNFASGYKKDVVGLPHPEWINDEMRGKMLDYFDNTKSGRYGIIPMDFVDVDRVKGIIDTNFAKE